jgi:hypothetical protein
MRAELTKLQKEIKEHLELFDEIYKNALNILEQINLLLEYEFNNDKIQYWFQSNKHTIRIIREIIYKENR